MLVNVGQQARERLGRIVGQPRRRNVGVNAQPVISNRVSGVWSLWRVSLQTASGRDQRCVAIFLAEDGRSFLPTARAIWDRLIDLPTSLHLEENAVVGHAATAAYEASRRAAETQGAAVFDELCSAHRQSIARERKKGIQAFASRRRAIERQGLGTCPPPSSAGRGSARLDGGAKHA